jgi:tetratricopeptide (TPR) repeat protein
LSAGVDAVSRYAADDGIRMFALAAQAAARAGDDGCAARAHLERGRAGTSRGRFSEAFEDFRVALDLAVQCGSSQLELDARRELAGDVLVGLGRPISDCQAELDAALVVARAVGDAAHEADLLARSAVVSANRLQFGRAIADGRRSVEIARQTGDPQILAIALDGLKNPFAYTGQIAELESTLAEVEPLVRLAHDVFRIQWCVFEHGFVPLATGRWDEARAAVEAALTLNRESGWTAFESWFLSHLGWVARLDGRLDDAVEHGRRAVRLHQQGSHPWWSSTAYAMLAGSLLAQGGAERRTEAAELLRHGLDAAGRSGVEAFRLRCVAVLAEATGDEPSRNEAQRMFARVSAPAGVAWMHGVDAYVALGRAWLVAGRADRAAELLAPVAAAARTSGWSALFQAAGGADLLARAASSDARQAGGVRGARSDQLGEAGGDPVGGAGGDR